MHINETDQAYVRSNYSDDVTTLENQGPSNSSIVIPTSTLSSKLNVLNSKAKTQIRSQSAVNIEKNLQKNVLVTSSPRTTTSLWSNRKGKQNHQQQSISATSKIGSTAMNSRSEKANDSQKILVPDGQCSQMESSSTHGSLHSIKIEDDLQKGVVSTQLKIKISDQDIAHYQDANPDRPGAESKVIFKPYDVPLDVSLRQSLGQDAFWQRGRHKLYLVDGGSRYVLEAVIASPIRNIEGSGMRDADKNLTHYTDDWPSPIESPHRPPESFFGSNDSCLNTKQGDGSSIVGLVAGVNDSLYKGGVVDQSNYNKSSMHEDESPLLKGRCGAESVAATNGRTKDFSSLSSSSKIYITPAPSSQRAGRKGGYLNMASYEGPSMLWSLSLNKTASEGQKCRGTEMDPSTKELETYISKDECRPSRNVKLQCTPIGGQEKCQVRANTGLPTMTGEYQFLCDKGVLPRSERLDMTCNIILNSNGKFVSDPNTNVVFLVRELHYIIEGSCNYANNECLDMSHLKLIPTSDAILPLIEPFFKRKFDFQTFNTGDPAAFLDPALCMAAVKKAAMQSEVIEASDEFLWRKELIKPSTIHFCRDQRRPYANIKGQEVAAIDIQSNELWILSPAFFYKIQKWSQRCSPIVAKLEDPMTKNVYALYQNRTAKNLSNGKQYIVKFSAAEIALKDRYHKTSTFGTKQFLSHALTEEYQRNQTIKLNSFAGTLAYGWNEVLRTNQSREIAIRSEANYHIIPQTFLVVERATGKLFMANPIEETGSERIFTKEQLDEAKDFAIAWKQPLRDEAEGLKDYDEPFLHQRRHLVSNHETTIGTQMESILPRERNLQAVAVGQVH